MWNSAVCINPVLLSYSRLSICRDHIYHDIAYNTKKAYSLFVQTLHSHKTAHTSPLHYKDVIMCAIASQITRLTIVYSTVYSDTDYSKYQSPASLAFVPGIHRGPVNSPHKWPITRKMFPFDDVIMTDGQWDVFSEYLGVLIPRDIESAFRWAIELVASLKTTIFSFTIMILILLLPWINNHVSSINTQQ